MALGRWFLDHTKNIPMQDRRNKAKENTNVYITSLILQMRVYLNGNQDARMQALKTIALNAYGGGALFEQVGHSKINEKF